MVWYGMVWYNKNKKISRIKNFWNYIRKKNIELELMQFAIGFNSEVDISQDLHIIFLDFDNVTLEDVEASVKEAQLFWGLSDAFLYKTRRGFHCIFYYDIVHYARVRMIIDYTRLVDNQFRNISRFYDYRSIRVVGKYKTRDIQFVKVLKGSRVPTDYEFEVGSLKRKERGYIADMADMLNKERLKE